METLNQFAITGGINGYPVPYLGNLHYGFKDLKLQRNMQKKIKQML